MIDKIKHKFIVLVLFNKISKKIYKISANENTLWTPGSHVGFQISPKSGRGPSNEYFWQVWFNSVQE
jgi:hypothetical protein